MTDWRDEIDNPLGRLSALPNMMGWRGGWTEELTYFKNEAVIDPENTGTYVYTGFNVSIQGGLPPSQVIGPSIWTAIDVGISNGVQTLRKGEGIILEGSDTIPRVVNGGVLETQLTSFANIGTDQIQILEYEGVTSLLPGPGIQINGTNNINNSGLLNIVGSPGISSVKSGSSVTLANAGVVQLTLAYGTPLSIISPGQNPSVQNTGLLSITPSTGIDLDPDQPPNKPKILNKGVVSISGVNISVTSLGDGIKSLKMIYPRTCLAYTINSPPLVPSPITFGNAIINVTQRENTVWSNYLENGPYTVDGGLFMLGTPFCIECDYNAAVLTFQLYMRDETQTPMVELGPYTLKGGIVYTYGYEPNAFLRTYYKAIPVSMGKLFGFRKLTSFRINWTGKFSNSDPQVLRIHGVGPAYATLYNFNSSTPGPIPGPPSS